MAVKNKKRLPNEEHLFFYEKKGKTYYGFDKWLGGKRRERAGFTSKKSAKEALYKLIAKFENDPTSILNPKIKLSELIERHIESLSKKQSSESHLQKSKMILTSFKSLTSNLPLEKLNESHLSEYVESLRKKGCKNSTIHLHLTIIRSCLNSAKKHWPKLLWNSPKLEQRIFKSERIEPEVTAETIENIIKVLRGMNTVRSIDVADMVLISSQTALRLGEVISLKWVNVSLISGIRSPHGRLVFVSEKTREVSQVPLTKSVKQIFLRRSGSYKKQDRVFNWNIQFNSMKVKVDEIFKEACTRVGILYGRDVQGGIRFHSLRHFVARSLLDAGHDLATVGAFGRWKKESMVMLYGKANSKGLDQARQNIERLFPQDEEERLKQSS